MPSVYKFVLHGLRLALEFYFVDVQATGKEVVPSTGPLIFAANHPNSIMDTIILATQTRRRIRYLARSGLFKNPLMSAFFRYFGAIPVYRSQDDPAQMNRNASTFQDAWTELERGGCIGIFPEGRNAPERQVGQIKTGVARLALGAEALHNYDLGVRIIPVGLNFEDRDRFMSSVLVRFGPPIDPAEFAQLHRDDERAAVRALTDTVQQALRTEAMHIEDGQHQDLIRSIHAIYGQHLLKQWFGDAPKDRDRGLVKRFFNAIQSVPRERVDMEEHFWVKRQIANAVAHFHKTEPELLPEIRSDLRRYNQHLGHARIRHDFLERSPSSVSVRRTSILATLYAIIFFLPAFIGLAVNIVPNLICRFAANRAPDEPIRAITSFGTGLVVFPFFYSPILWVTWIQTGSLLWTAAVMLLLPSLGFYWLRYRQRLARYQDKILIRTIFRSNRILLRVLSKDRDRLIERLDALRNRYERDIESNGETTTDAETSAATALQVDAH